MTDYYLSHHGVLGQRWGIRRYQRKDGTLTAAGKKRYKNDIVFNKDNAHNHISKQKTYVLKIGRRMFFPHQTI